MKGTATCLFLAAMAALGVAGCAPSGGGPATASPEAEAARAKYLLTNEPAGAASVVDARKDAENDEEVVVVGRIGGEVDPWVKGVAAFLIADTSLKACNELEDDACPYPWDFCCEDPEELNRKKIAVRVVDEAGETVPIDARELLGVQELSTVVVRGKAVRDEQGNLTLLATGVFVR
jgi:hypothetical protein